MDRICLVVDSGQQDNSAPKLVEQIQKLGLSCTQSDVAPTGTFAVGWGRAGRIPGLNCERPHNKLWELERLREAGVPTVPFDSSFEAAMQRAWDDLRSQGKRAILFGRRKESRKQGKDIVQFELAEKTRKEQLAIVCPEIRDYWTQVVPKVAEYRVHSFRSRVDRVANGAVRLDK